MSELDRESVIAVLKDYVDTLTYDTEGVFYPSFVHELIDQLQGDLDQSTSRSFREQLIIHAPITIQDANQYLSKTRQTGVTAGTVLQVLAQMRVTYADKVIEEMGRESE